MATESFFSNASLAYLASAGAGKDGKTYSIKPTDGSGDFTFSRGSNLAATRVGPTGLIEKGRENLLTYSNQFDNSAWLKGNASVTSGQTGYDGSSDAFSLNANTNTSSHYINKSSSQSGVYTFSIYMKAGTFKNVLIYFIGPNQGVNFDTSAQSFYAYEGGGANIVSYDVEILSNGWARYSVTSAVALTNTRIYLKDNSWNISYAGTTADNILIQSAQLEIGLAATEVITTGATTVKAGLLEDEPRFDYSGGATCPSLLLEPSRTQLIKYSEYYGDLAPTRITLTSNYGISPEGIQNAAAIFNTTENGRHNLNGAYFVVTSGTSYVNSVFAKAGTITKMKLRMFSGGGTDIGFNDGDFDLTNGTATGTGAGIESYGNGWYRCYVVDSPTSSASNARFNIELLDANGGISYVGSVTDYIEIYGSQVEEGSYPTSYIPNHSGGSVTRGVDDINKLTGVGVTSDEFTIFLELDLSDTPLVSNVGTYFQTFDSSNNSQQEFRFFSYSGEQVLVPYFRQDASYAFGNGGNAVRFDGKVLFRSDGGGSYTMFFGFNGSSTKEVRTGLTAYTLDKIDFISQPKTNVKQLLIFNEALSDADCTTLTT